MAEEGLSKYLDPAVVNSVKRLDLQARCIVEGFISGRHRSPFHGFSTTFSEHRKYNSGDPIKDIDWNVYARTERHYIKKYEAETNLECMLIVDTSKSMAYRSAYSEVSKLEYSVLVAAALSYMLIKQQDSVGLMTFDSKLCHFLKPGSKLSQLKKILAILSTARQTEGTSYMDGLGKSLGLIKHRGLVVFFSDFLGDTEEAFKVLRMLRFKKHDVVVFHMFDPAELDLPFEDMGRFVDSEDSSQFLTANADQIREAYREEIEQFIGTVKKECEALKANYIQVRSSEPFDKVIQEFLLHRKQFA